MQRLLKLKKFLRNTNLSVFSENLRNPKHAEERFRPLTSAEIESLEKNGNRCDDWTKIRVEGNFTPERIYRSVFIGSVYLPAFFGTLLLPGDVSFPTGIYDSILHNCVVENALVYRVSMLSNVFVSRFAILQNVGTLVSSGKLQFLKSISVGNECGTRNLMVYPDTNQNFLEHQLDNLFATDFQNQYEAILNEWQNEIKIHSGFIGPGAVLSNIGVVRNSWIGPHARIVGASKIRGSIVLSSLEETTGIYDSVILENSIVQESCMIHSAAQVKNSLVLKKTKIGKMALVSSSIISNCCHIEEAEVTSSFVGPLTQLHHHSLLIAALWPKGCGNIGYGANVGSNHTGRKPDQEIHPGIGTFFGLGVNIKFPANFKNSPFLLIASGVTTSPQRLELPFALIRPGNPEKYGLSKDLNEVVPGFGYGKNAFALERNLQKYAQRGKNIISSAFYSLFSVSNVRAVYNAFVKLQEVTVQEIYTGKDLNILGSNYMREPVRQFALQVYRNFLERFLFESVLTAVESDSSMILLSPKEILRSLPGEVFKERFSNIELPATVPEVLKRLRALSKQWVENVLAGDARDKERGQAIFDDYQQVHPEDKAFYELVKGQHEQLIRRIQTVLKDSREEA